MAGNNEWLVTLRTLLKEKINVFKSDLVRLKWIEILNCVAAACWAIYCMLQLCGVALLLQICLNQKKKCCVCIYVGGSTDSNMSYSDMMQVCHSFCAFF